MTCSIINVKLHGAPLFSTPYTPLQTRPSQYLETSLLFGDSWLKPQSMLAKITSPGDQSCSTIQTCTKVALYTTIEFRMPLPWNRTSWILQSKIQEKTSWIFMYTPWPAVYLIHSHCSITNIFILILLKNLSTKYKIIDIHLRQFHQISQPTLSANQVATEIQI